MAATILGADAEAMEKKATLGDSAMVATASLGVYEALTFDKGKPTTGQGASDNRRTGTTTFVKPR
jgi:hypothetical protein